jgi:hypothetical protein
MRGKARDILILLRITDFFTTSSAGLKRRNNGRKGIYQFLYTILFISLYQKFFTYCIALYISGVKICQFYKSDLLVDIYFVNFMKRK